MDYKANIKKAMNTIKKKINGLNMALNKDKKGIYTLEIETKKTSYVYESIDKKVILDDIKKILSSDTIKRVNELFNKIDSL